MDETEKTKGELLIELHALRQKDKFLESELSKMETDRSMLEFLLKSENENLNVIFESSPVGLLLLDEDINIVRANRAMIDMIGGSEDNIVNHRPGNAFTCIHSSQDPGGCGYSEDCPLCPTRKSIEALLEKGGSVKGAEIPMQLVRNGELCEVWMEFGAGNLLLNGKKHLCVSINDITGRKNTEEALKNSEAHYRLLAEGIHDVVWKQDSRNVFTYLSPADERLRGFKPEEVIGHHVAEILTPEGVDLIRKKMQQRMTDEQNGIKTDIITFQVQQRCKDGSLVWTEVISTAEHDENGNLSGYHGISRNITERKKIEIQLQDYAVELNKQIAQKDKFFSIIAHDLKNPFNGIIGFSELLIDRIRMKDYDGIEEYGNIVHQSSRRAMDLLINLMEWSRSQTGRMEFNPEFFEIVQVIQDVSLLFQEVIRQKSVSIRFDLPERLQIFADTAMLSTVLRNLISNAVKFSRSGDSITVSLTSNEKQHIFSVRDTGTGMSQASLDLLFRIDETHSTPGTNKETGTGLGLILCKEFVDKHHGEIWAESEKGKGSTFFFTIPKEMAG